MPTAQVAGAIGELRRSVADLPADLTASGSFLFTTGIVSVRVPGTDLVVRKPSGVSADDLAADSVEVVDLLDARSGGGVHADVHRAMPEVGAVVNTRSTLALATAARGEPVPHLPAIMGGSNGQIPVGRARSETGEAIGRTVVDTLRSSGSPAVLVRTQGLFTTGPTPVETFKAAALREHLIRTVHIARHLGTAEPLDPHDLAWLQPR